MFTYLIKNASRKPSSRSICTGLYENQLFQLLGGPADCCNSFGSEEGVQKIRRFHFPRSLVRPTNKNKFRLPRLLSKKDYATMMINTSPLVVSSLAFLLLGLVILCYCRPPADAISPTPYPDAFSMDFVTNVIVPNGIFKKRSTALVDNILNGTLFYDWRKKSQRIDHAAGSYECVHFYNTSAPCSLLFLPSGGMYRVIHHHHHREDQIYDPAVSHQQDQYDGEQDELDCCLDLPNVGTPPPNWASSPLINATYNGLVMDVYSNLLAHQWSFDQLLEVKENGHDDDDHHRSKRRAQQDKDTTNDTVQRSLSDDGLRNVYNYHTTREVAYGPYASRPLVFTFPGGAVGRQDYHYLVDTLKQQSQDAALFDLPESCIHRLCEQPRSPKRQGNMVQAPADELRPR
jgi:hypothetical protein